MEKIEFGALSEDELLSLILDKTLCAKALLEKIIFPNFADDSSKYDKKIMDVIFKENLDYLASDNSMNQKILQAAIYNQALMYKIAFLYLAETCVKNPWENFDEVIKNFIDGVNSHFYELCVKMLSADKESDKEELQKGLTNE